MGYRLSNFIEATLQQSVAAAATTFYIEAGQEALFPVLTGGHVCRCVIEDGEQDPEIFDVTAHSAGALTVTRARESTSARDWPAGAIISIDLTAEVVNQILGTAAAVRYIGTASGTNAITVNVGAGNSIPTPQDGDEVSFLIVTDSTAAATLVITNGTTSTTAKDIRHQDNAALEEGDLQAGWLAVVRYNAANDKWILISPTSWNQHAYLMNDGPLVPANHASNGAFTSWKNGTSIADPASSAEVADGYYVEYDGTIGNFTVSRQSFTPGQTTVLGNPDYYLRWAHTTAGSGSTYRRLRTKVGRVGLHQGKKVLRSVYMKADSARTVTGTITQYFGTGGAPSASVSGGSQAFSVTTSWQRFELAVTLPSISGKTLGSNNDDALILSLDLPLNTTMTIEVAMDQFEPGHIASDPASQWPLDTRLGGTSRSYASWTTFTAAVAVDVLAALPASYPDLALVEALATSGLVFRNNTGPAWGTRSVAVGTGLTISNADGTAGNPTVGLDTALANYVADPLSVAELASITGNFGTAAFKNTGTSGNTVPLLDGANTFSTAQTISAATTGAILTLTNSDAGALGIQLDADHASASPAVSDVLFRFRAQGRDSGGNSTVYGKEEVTIIDATDTTEDARWSWYALVSGVSTEILRLEAGQIMGGDGSAAAPTFSFTGQTNTGIRRSAASVLRFVINGSDKTYINASGVGAGGGVFLTGNGSAGSPSFTAENDTNTGFYFGAADDVYLSLGGTQRVAFTTTAVTLASGIDAVFDSALGPSSVYSLGFRGAPLMGGAAVNAARTFSAGDMGKTAYHDEVTARTWTIDSNANYAAPIGSFMILDNTGNTGAAGAITVSITSDTLRRGDGVAGTGSRTIAAGAVAMVRKTKSTEWVITGTFT